MLWQGGGLRVGPVYDYHVVRPVDTVEDNKYTGEQVEGHGVHRLLELLGFLILYIFSYLSVEPGWLWPLRDERIVLRPAAVPQQSRLSVPPHQALPPQVGVGLQRRVETTLLRPANGENGDGVICYNSTLGIDILSQFLLKNDGESSVSHLTSTIRPSDWEKKKLICKKEIFQMKGFTSCIEQLRDNIYSSVDSLTQLIFFTQLLRPLRKSNIS